MSEISKLRVYSLGIVAANKALSSKEIEVTPIEDLPMLNGELSDNAAQVSSRAADTEGGAYETQVSTAATVRATWLPLGYGNRITAPDVRRGERVILYRFADQDKFWWVTQGQDMHLRKLETVIWGISATRNESAKPDASNMYWMEWSTHKKLIHLHTSKADGEPYAYDIQINTAYGSIIIQDDDGNSLSLDSVERVWRMINRDGTKFEGNKREAFIHAEDLVKITSKRVETIAGQAIVEQAGSTIENTAGASHTTAAPQVTINGQTQVNGTVSTSSTITSQGNIVGEGVSLGEHVHREQGDGQLTTAPQ